jgi:hypothetical protein
MLAERVRTPLLVALGLSAAATFLAWPHNARKHHPVHAPSIVVSAFPTADSIEITDFCPPHVRAAMHLDDDAMLYCVRGQFPEPGTFVFAQYRTTEAWERFAVVADPQDRVVVDVRSGREPGPPDARVPAVDGEALGDRARELPGRIAGLEPHHLRGRAELAGELARVDPRRAGARQGREAHDRLLARGCEQLLDEARNGCRVHLLEVRLGHRGCAC